jgi:hypothetical protein
MRDAVFLGSDAVSRYDLVERLEDVRDTSELEGLFNTSALYGEAADEITRLRAELATATAELDELQVVFDKTREANMRAIKRWQEVTGRDKSWPDHDYLILWLLEQWDEARSRFNDMDLCREGQAPCEWALKLIAERDDARALLLSIEVVFDGFASRGANMSDGELASLFNATYDRLLAYLAERAP